ncbi:MAG: hypothetical protein ABR520_00665 [Mycobacteriales bacterium]
MVPAKAAPPTFAQAYIAPAGCVVADIAARGRATVVGFGTCAPSGIALRIIFVEGTGGEWRQELSPYNGQVVAVADDGQTTFALIFDDAGLAVVGRRADGTYLSPRVVHSNFGVTPEADLVASAGQWWAVWTYGGPLFQATTLGRTRATQQITYARTPGPSHTLSDHDPFLQLSDGTIWLAWSHLSRQDDDTGKTVGTGHYDLRVSTSSIRTARWSSVAAPISPNVFNRGPQIASLANHVAVAWEADLVPYFADRVYGARFRRVRLGASACDFAPYVRLVALRPRVNVAFNGCASESRSDRRIVVTTRTAARWTVDDVTPAHVSLVDYQLVSSAQTGSQKVVLLVTETVAGVQRSLALEEQ